MASLTKTYDSQKLLGQVYTPKFIVDKILDEAGYTSSACLGKSILDPACGDGRFLVEIVRRIVSFSSEDSLPNNLKNVSGWDIDKEAIAICRKSLDAKIEELGLEIEWNLVNKDALEETNPDQSFEYIVGNPPYIRIQHLPEEQRAFLQENYRFCRSGSTDTFVAFFELADRLLAESGVCGFITPNSYFFSETARPLRRYFQENQNLKLITNYGSERVFDKTGTYSAITIFGKKTSRNFRYELSDSSYEYSSRNISFAELRDNDLWQLSIDGSISKTGVRLGDICQISVGVTTLSDKLYLFNIIENDSDEVVVATSKAGERITIERSILKPIIKASRLKNSQEPISEYILFPYKKNAAGKHTIIPEHTLKEKYPLAYSYLSNQKKILDKRDNGKLNPVAWYAFGRAQALDTSFGKKIVFSPMNKYPKFILCENEEATVYSGYFIKYGGDYEKLLSQLNSKAMADYMAVAGRDFRGGWKGYSKKIVENFRLSEPGFLAQLNPDLAG
ncbi:Eco57I restriction-modification methylase domain-containing protein [Persicitalea sp.]|uniref:Eco57I restriction-modification methylase domain-containing protein n=1 Tax=Persicitalea sp. TaxID=3100273 RepID=UPI0035930B6E